MASLGFCRFVYSLARFVYPLEKQAQAFESASATVGWLSGCVMLASSNHLSYRRIPSIKP